jgi:hypothetical protein
VFDDNDAYGYRYLKCSQAFDNDVKASVVVNGKVEYQTDRLSAFEVDYRCVRLYTRDNLEVCFGIRSNMTLEIDGSERRSIRVSEL